MKTKRTIDLITMGCSKNLVDTEHLMRQFQECGFTLYHNPEATHGDIAIVNTCGFIGDAKEESINMILELSEQKERGELNEIYVMGCLSERYKEELQAEIPTVDKFYGKFDWPAMLQELNSQYQESLNNERVLTTPEHYAYIKISEGCDRKCAYCAIPIITGRHVSRPMEEIIEEVRNLVAKGVKEFQIIAQELTYYGIDLYKQQMLPQLIEQMSEIPGVEWIRLHYAYPNHFPMDLLRVMRERPNVCNYIDIALQHISDSVLSRMQRHTTAKETIELLQAMRREVPGICIRTTLMVGFPGETEEDFEELMDFVRTTRFDRMGAFAYSEEEGTYAAEHYEDDIPEDVKQNRLDRLMELQERISAELCAEKIGQECRVIIDRQEGDYYIGRTEHDSPEVDCEVLIPAGTPMTSGSFHQVRITGADEYDLYAEVINA
ncbi:MAG: 30S ribosomal protein S12 methylthiotransferase RimO [Bacteroidaceae bacterium]|nr:30S ribosomal protein S12 methylthiotransferase RimO [Bacteroidaceae bacterium]